MNSSATRRGERERLPIPDLFGLYPQITQIAQIGGEDGMRDRSAEYGIQDTESLLSVFSVFALCGLCGNLEWKWICET